MFFRLPAQNRSVPVTKEVKTVNNNIKQNAKEGLNNLKFEVAKEIGVNLKNGYNGDLTSKEAGHIGGNMVKKLIEKGEQSL
ncbi:MAG: alpha/beta-type small acid-soluble spore protein [Clostridia bacterium]|nr:alpha/beta-type small acid-soluble spore protein [Clostridia bacterium]